MSNQQTAVEWLVEQMFKQGYFDGNKPLTFTNLDHLQEQANKMFEEQTKDAFVECWKSNVIDGIECKLDAEQYYNESYGSKGSNSTLKPHSFCETPDENCTLNYCDENGCLNRKRELADEKGQPLTYWGELKDRTCTNYCSVVCGECQLPSDILKNIISSEPDWNEEPLNYFSENFGEDCEAVKNWDSFVEQKNIELEVNKLAEEDELQFIKKQLENIEYYKLGYNVAQRKLYTKEEMELCWIAAMSNRAGFSDSISYKEFIQSLKQ